jgi:hypothetical protein
MQLYMMQQMMAQRQQMPQMPGQMQPMGGQQTQPTGQLPSYGAPQTQGQLPPMGGQMTPGGGMGGAPMQGGGHHGFNPMMFMSPLAGMFMSGHPNIGLGMISPGLGIARALGAFK